MARKWRVASKAGMDLRLHLDQEICTDDGTLSPEEVEMVKEALADDRPRLRGEAALDYLRRHGEDYVALKTAAVRMRRGKFIRGEDLEAYMDQRRRERRLGLDADQDEQLCDDTPE